MHNTNVKLHSQQHVHFNSFIESYKSWGLYLVFLGDEEGEL